MNKLRQVLVFLVSVAILGCGNASITVADWFGTADKTAPAPITEDILCDASAGSTCNAHTLRETADSALHAAANRPGSLIRVWMQGRNVETTCLITESRSEKTRGTGRRARTEHEARWIAGELAKIGSAAEQAVRKPAHRSPIAESIGIMALAPPVPKSRRELTIISDGMEVSDFGEFECGPLPKPERFTRSLARNRVLTPGSLTNVVVRFCHFDLGAIDHGRCSASLYRTSQLRALWQSALTAAGASSVEIRQGALDANATVTSRKDLADASAIQSRRP